jgi:hypothetical protein
MKTKLSNQISSCDKLVYARCQRTRPNSFVDKTLYRPEKSDPSVSIEFVWAIYRPHRTEQGEKVIRTLKIFIKLYFKVFLHSLFTF